MGSKAPSHHEETQPGQSRAWLRAGVAPSITLGGSSRPPQPRPATRPQRRFVPDPNSHTTPPGKPRMGEGTEPACPGGPEHSPAPSGSDPRTPPPRPRGLQPPTSVPGREPRSVPTRPLRFAASPVSPGPGPGCRRGLAAGRGGPGFSPPMG